MFYSILLPTALDKTFTYRGIRVQSTQKLSSILTGQVVKVSFGKKLLWGVVWSVDKNLPSLGGKVRSLSDDILKPIEECAPVVFPDTLRVFVEKVAAYTLTPKGSVLKMVMSVQGAFDKVWEDKALSSTKEAFTKEVCQKNATHAQLSPAQLKALSALLSCDEKKPVLLYGATGSGKTEVYLKWLQKHLDSVNKNTHAGRKKQALVLLPEIALTPQWCVRFEKRFGFAPTLWHAHLTPAKRRNAYVDIIEGRARVIVGARSALFLPYKNLCAIVVDEEHDVTFKQEDGVRYHARDMAVLRAHLERVPLCLASATPSFETLNNVLEKRYGEVTLSTRFKAEPPVITTAPLPKDAARNLLSEALLNKLQENLDKKEQSLVFLNRRGYAPFVSCKTCSHIVLCPHCERGMVFHQKANLLLCHVCQFQTAPVCARCQGETTLTMQGYGVERVADHIQQAFPKARLQVMSSDHMTPKRLQQLVRDLEDRKIDILIGTQMVAKGHHFPRLTFVGILDIDYTLNHFDFRAQEHLYQLLEQVAGRAGRGAVKGEVMLQTGCPEHSLIESFQKIPYAVWSSGALDERLQQNLPPKTRMAALIIEGISEEKVRLFAQNLAQEIPEKLASSLEVQVWGPAPAPMAKVRGRFRYRFLVHALKGFPHAFLKAWLLNIKVPFSIRLQIDIDPHSFH